MNNYFQTYSNCLITEGYSRSIICDLQGHNLFLIPNEIKEIIKELNNKKSVIFLKTKYGNQIIDDILSFLEKKQYGFFCELNDFDLFPKLDTKFDTADKITNIIFELEEYDLKRIHSVAKISKKLNVEAISFIFYFKIEIEEIKEIINIFNFTNLDSIQFIFRYLPNDKTVLENLIESNNVVNCIIFNSTNKNNSYFRYINKDLPNFSFCGGVSSEMFNVNYKKVLEAINFNSCLYKKMTIDRKGNIKNCPNIDYNYGKVEDFDQDIINTSEFTSLGAIKKDSIDVCKDCEFRYVCTDCRAYIENPSDKYSKPLKCGYNPYTNEWNDWSTNPIKQKAIKHYTKN